MAYCGRKKISAGSTELSNYPTSLPDAPPASCRACSLPDLLVSQSIALQGHVLDQHRVKNREEAGLRTLDVAGEGDVENELLVRVRLDPFVVLVPFVPRSDYYLSVAALLCVERDDVVAVDVLVEVREFAFEDDVGVLVAALAACRMSWCHSVR